MTKICIVAIVIIHALIHLSFSCLIFVRFKQFMGNITMGNISGNIQRKINTLKKRNHSNRGAKPINALLIVDVQYDFIDGTLALKDCPSHHQGEQVIPIINKLLNDIHFDIIVYTQDWHTPDHISFHENLPLRAHLLAKDSKKVDELKVFDTAIFLLDDEAKTKKLRVEQILWPTHCVQHSHGAELHKDLHIVKPNKHRQVVNLFKGNDSDIDSYSAFWDNQKIRETALNTKLKEHNVTNVFIAGIATDVCVYSTALHAVEYGYRTFIVEDACRGVDVANINLRLDELIKRNCVIVQANEIKDII
ncbi:unnamed protein product [Rotaria sordida]|uniref:nicotinamidase n=1 Tax=Rotaria sordida TaxID=392033 RepID=A0A813T8P4_9BILA|nr:unnamed protein product [Rotaria sordida]